MTATLPTLCVRAALLIAASVSLPATAEPTFVGAASCGSGNCHGKVAPELRSTVLRNEHRTWSVESRHARAYQTLLTAQARQIATTLGLSAAHTSPTCLGCHSTPTAELQRGARFRTSDGVSCEACHGPAGEWLVSHRDQNVSSAAERGRGMTQLADPAIRAAVCVGCHIGDDNRFANHRLLSAGHPRLIFELDAFSQNQPVHHRADADYRARKPQGEKPGLLWLHGQLAAARADLGLIARYGHAPSGDQLWPEFAVHDCHSCHHPMNDDNYGGQQVTLPGRLRLRDSHFQLLGEAVAVLAPDRASAYRAAVATLLTDAQQGRNLQRAVAVLQKQLTALSKQWLSLAPTRQQLAEIRSGLLSRAARNGSLDYSDAAQIMLAIDTLSLQLGDTEQLAPQINSLFQQVINDTRYGSRAFARAARQLSERLDD